MRKYFYCILIAIFITSLTSAQFNNVERTGGLARVRSMGESPFMIDPYFMTFNPAWAAVYSNFVWGDLGSDNGTATGGTGQFLGANINVVPDLTLGIILSRSDFQVSNIGVQIASIDPLGTIDGFDNNIIGLNNNVEVMGAFTLSDNVRLGLGVSYTSSGNEVSPSGFGTSTYDAHQFGLNAGLLASFGELGVDAGVSLLFPGASVETPGFNKRTISQTILSIQGRVFVPVSSKLQFVPLASFTNASGSFDNGTTSTDLASITQFAVGAGANYRIEDFLITGGIGFETVSATQKATQFSPEISNSRTTFPAWNVGGEWNFTKWLAGRIGYISSRGSITNQTPSGSASGIDEQIFTFYGPTGYTLGLGFKFTRFSLSATVNERVLREGLNNIGGGTPTFAYLSATVAF